MDIRHVSVVAPTLAGGRPRAARDSDTVGPGHTYPSFEISRLGFSTQRGRFDKSSGRVPFDRDAKTASVEISIDANSIDTGNPKLEEHLRKADFFDVAQFPT